MKITVALLLLCILTAQAFATDDGDMDESAVCKEAAELLSA